MGRSRAGEAHVEDALHARGDARQPLLHRIEGLQHALRLDVELPARIGEGHALGMPHEQRHAHLRLDGLDLLAERWLLQAQALRRTGHMPRVGDRGEVAQLSNLHIASISISSNQYI
jgi:hypothetical protein